MIRVALFALISVIAALPAAAQDWPSKPVKFVVPFPPGGSVDPLARWGKIVKDNGIKVD